MVFWFGLFFFFFLFNSDMFGKPVGSKLLSKPFGSFNHFTFFFSSLINKAKQKDFFLNIL